MQKNFDQDKALASLKVFCKSRLDAEQEMKIVRKSVLEQFQRGTQKRYPPQDREKWDLVIIYHTLARLEVWEKTAFWHHLGTMLETHSWKQGFRTAP